MRSSRTTFSPKPKRRPTTCGGGARRFSAAKAVDGRADTYWATDDGVTAATLSLRFERPRRVNRILLQEYIPLGQRVGRFAVEWLDGDTWRPSKPRRK